MQKQYKIFPPLKTGDFFKQKTSAKRFITNFAKLKKTATIAFFVFLFSVTSINAVAQCSLCTKTAQQLGEGPASGLNSGILYLMMAPFAIVGVIGYRWWKSNR